GTIHISKLWHDQEIEDYRKRKDQLRKYKIMYIDQLLDFRYEIMTWKYLRTRLKAGKGITPKWFAHAEQRLITDPTHIQTIKDLTKNEYNTTNNKKWNYATPEKGKWMAIQNTSQEKILYGKISRIEKDDPMRQNPDKLVENYVIHYIQIKDQNTETRILNPCPGCSLKDNKASNKRTKCMINYTT